MSRKRSAGPPRPPPWLEIEGFKSLRSPCRVALRPLTLLAGANSAGKSSVVQPLLLLKQTLEAPYDAGPMRLNGGHLRFTSPDEFLSRGPRRADRAEALRITLGPLDDGTPALRLTFRRTGGRKAELARLEPAGLEAQATGSPWVPLDGSTSVGDLARLHDAHAPERAQAFREIDGLGARLRFERQRIGATFHLQGPETGATARSDVDPVRFFQRLAQFLVVGASFSIGTHHQEWLAGILHLPGHRGHRERRFAATQPEWIEGPQGRGAMVRVHGAFTPYAAGILATWGEGERGGSTHLARVNAAMKALGLTWKVEARRVNASEIQLRVGRTARARAGGAHDLVDIADVGFGVSQVLPVVVALEVAAPGQVVYVEQPELHLHPRAQLGIGRLLASAARRGVFVVAETHSILVLRAVQAALASGEVHPDAVALHWFERDEATGESRVHLATPDARGVYGDWPVDFAEAADEADWQWMRLLVGEEPEDAA